MNSLPPRLCRVREGVGGLANEGECGGVEMGEAALEAEGLKTKSGSAFDGTLVWPDICAGGNVGVS